MRVKLILLSTCESEMVIEKLFQAMYSVDSFQFLQKMKSDIDTDCIFVYELDRNLYSKNSFDVFIEFLKESKFIKNYFAI